MFSVVEFVKSKSVAAVPDSWVDRSNQICWWPPATKQCSQLIKSQTHPDKLLISAHDIRILKCNIATYTEAKSVEVEAQYQSDFDDNEAPSYTTLKNALHTLNSEPGHVSTLNDAPALLNETSSSTHDSSLHSLDSGPRHVSTPSDAGLNQEISNPTHDSANQNKQMCDELRLVSRKLDNLTNLVQKLTGKLNPQIFFFVSQTTHKIRG
uniref:Uncharacterized protein n=1 Tax=Cacopsylla melanoneura TaxID=428564 RepID=A0A8D8Z3R2_9HEMI